jgi:predicted nucleic acid-binding Zn ribbon protein
MPENLPDHTHCLECDAAIPWGKPYCSDKCDAEHKAKVKRQKNRNLLYTILLIGVIMSLALVTLLL